MYRSSVFFLLCIIGFLNYSLAQPVLDSIFQVGSSKQGYDKISFYNELAERYSETDLTIAGVLSEEALKLSEEINYSQGKAKSLQLLGLISYFNGQFNQSIYYSTLAKTIAADLKNTGLEKNINTILALVYEESKEFDKSIELYSRNLKISMENSDQMGIAMEYQNLGRQYEKRNQLELALKYYRSSLGIYENLSVPQGLCNVNNDIGRLFLLYKKDSAGYYLYQSFNLLDTLGNKETAIDVMWNLAEYYQLNMNRDSTQYFLELALQIADSGNDMYGRIACYEKLSEFYSKSGDYKRAYESGLILAELKDSMQSKGLSYENNARLEQLEDENRGQANELLKKEAQLKNIQWMNRDILYYMVGGAVFGIIFISIALYIRFKVYKKAFVELTNLKHEIRALSVELENKEMILNENRKKAEKERKLIETLKKLIGIYESSEDSQKNKLTILLRSISENIDASYVGVYFLNKENLLECLGDYNYTADRLISGQILDPVEYPVYYDSLRMTKVIISENCGTDPITKEFYSNRFITNQTQKRIDIPVLADKKLIGVVFAERTSYNESWNEEEINFLSNISEAVKQLIYSYASSKNKSREKDIIIQLNSFKAVIAALKLPLIIIDSKKRIVLANPVFWKLIGKKPEGPELGSVHMFFPEFSSNPALFDDPEKILSTTILASGNSRQNCQIVISHFEIETEHFRTLTFLPASSKPDLEPAGEQQVNESILLNLDYNSTMPLYVINTISLLSGTVKRIDLTRIIKLKNSLLNLPVMDSSQQARAYFQLHQILNDVKFPENDSTEILWSNIYNEIYNISGLLQNHQTSVDVDQLLAFITGSLRIHQSKQIVFHTDLQFGAKINCNLFLLYFVLVQVLLNSIESIKNEGDIYIKSINENSSLIIKFIDTGEGIAKEIKSDLFSPKTTTKNGHSGMGLYYVKKIINFFGGEIKIRSQHNKGTEVYITIPY